MKILLITSYVPTPENVRGISALEYYLIKHRPVDIELDVLCYNLNKCDDTTVKCSERQLGVRIELIHPSCLYILTNKYRFLGKLATYLLPRNLFVYSYDKSSLRKYINKKRPDCIWLYPFFYIDIAKDFPHIQFVLTGSDCNSLFYDRWISQNEESSSFLNKMKKKFTLRQLIHTERAYAKPNVKVHFVGDEDVAFYKKRNKSSQAYFIHHPYYGTKGKKINFGNGKLRVILAGKNDFYMKDDGEKVLATLLTDNIKDKITITFLGKGWQEPAASLKNVGYECNVIEWVDDYIDEIVKYDIQISPISLGTGTKGKVLDAISNGLLCIGSEYALENIAVKNGESCVKYNDTTEISNILVDIYNNRHKYESMAARGRDLVREHHDPDLCAIQFFNLFKNKEQ